MFNIQFLGVEAYYEFVDNLKFLNEFSKTNKIKILINLHPAGKNSLDDLKEIFPSLEFNCEKKIDKVLRKVDITLSFSSTVIEDSYTQMFRLFFLIGGKDINIVMLKRIFLKKNSTIYYINEDKNLMKCINTIYNSKQISYKKYTYTEISSQILKILLIL